MNIGLSGYSRRVFSMTKSLFDDVAIERPIDICGHSIANFATHTLVGIHGENGVLSVHFLRLECLARK